jgi:hypothetical protein
VRLRIEIETVRAQSSTKAEGMYVAKKRGNPNWGKPELNTLRYTGATSFEEVAERLCLSPQEFGNSAQFMDWVQKEQGSQIRANPVFSNYGV